MNATSTTGAEERRRGRTSTVLLAVLALVIGLMVPGAAAQTPDCGPIVPNSEISRGMTGEGLTVVQGRTPVSFEVEVLGVLENGIGVGRDMIIVEVNAPFIDDAGGIWQGMSGSPVYVDGRLLGAVAYGLSFTASNIGGLTPAEDLVNLVGFQTSDPSFAAAEPATQATVTGELAADIQRRVGADGATSSQATSSQATFAQRGSVQLRQLPLPVSVSGLSSDRVDSLDRIPGAPAGAVSTYGGSSVDYTQAQTTDNAPVPGGNLAVAQSLGDVTFAAVGTATLVCDGKVIGFGHPFTARGETSAGAVTADAITIVPDDTFAPFKLANLDRVFGTIDQDRFEGVRADVGNFPQLYPVTSTVTDTDLGATRDGQTDVISQPDLPFIAAIHLLGNIDTVIDRFGEGSSQVAFTVTGTGEDSGPFSYTRENVYASTFDIAFDSIFEMLDQLFVLQSFPREEVTIDSVDIDLTVQEAISSYRLDGVRVGVDGAPPEPVGGEIIVEPGSTINMEVDLVGNPDEDETTFTVPLSLEVPSDAFGGGFLQISGGVNFFDECIFFPEACGEDSQTAQDLANRLATQPRNDALIADLQVARIGQGGDPGPGGTPTEGVTEEATAVPATVGASPGQSGASGGAGSDARSSFSGDRPAYLQEGDPLTTSAQLDRFIEGFFGLSVIVDSAVCPGCPPIFNRVAGEDRIGTAISTARYAFGAADTVVLAPADDYPAALVAGPLAATESAPVLLSRDGSLSAGVGPAITELGATRALIVAPDGQLTGAVEDDLRAAGITTIERLGGEDRYAVADAVAKRFTTTRAWLVEGENPDPARGWPDAVSVGPVAGYERVPILLTRAGDLPATTAQTLTDVGITDVSIGGGEAAVSQAVADDLAGRGINVERVAGADRYETSYLLAQRAIELGGVPFNSWMVTGLAFPDALSAAPAVVATGGVMIMGNGQDVTASPAAVQYFTDLQYTAPLVTFVGGFAAISQMVEEQVFGILIGPQPDSGDSGGGESGGGGSEEPVPTATPAQPEPSPTPGG